MQSVRVRKPGWFASFLGAGVLIAGGFGLGLLAGVVSEEPELVVGHLVGRSEEAVWLSDAQAADEGVVPKGEAIPEASALGESVVPEPVLPAVAAAPSRQRVDRSVRDIERIPIQGPAPAVRSGFSVQVGAFSDGVAAENVRRKLSSKGFDTYVTAANQSRDGKWRVRVGPVSNKGAAEKLASRLKTEERLPTWVVAEGGG